MTKATIASLTKSEEFSSSSQLNTVEVTVLETNKNSDNNSSNGGSESSTAAIKASGPNRLDRDGVNLSYDSNNVDMSLLSTVHVCAAQVRRLEFMRNTLSYGSRSHF
jgi:hypothetical protein